MLVTLLSIATIAALAIVVNATGVVPPMPAPIKWCLAPFSELDRYEAGSGVLLLLLLLVVVSLTAERIERVFAFFDLINSMGVK
jgi:hypothetical protein